MKIDDNELLAILRSDLAACAPTDGSSLSEERAAAMRYYLAQPFGNEVDGRSQVVTSDVSDTIEWLLPQLIKIFTSSDEAVQFDPVGPEDIEAAQQETDYLNHVFYKDNDGFMILYTWFKDALLSKNGIVKYYWEDETDITTEEYEGLTEMELRALLSDDTVEIMEQEIEVGPDGSPVISLKLKRSNGKGRVKIVCIPPEQFKVRTDHNSLDLDDVSFCAHERYTSKSELIEMGFPRSKVEELGAYPEDEDSREYDARFSDLETASFNDDDKEASILISECYKRMDANGDGIDELHKITLANESTILEDEEVDYIPFVAITPIVMTHRFVGRSIADITMDLQLIKSTLLRNILDNLYLINNVRMGVVEGEVNLDDALDSRPGGVVRMSAPNMMFPIQTTPFGGHSYQMMEYLDAMRENRTGVTRYNQGMSADVLNKTATGISKIMSASHERMMLIARLFADGVRRLFLGVHRLVLQNQQKERVIRIRNKWVPVDPSEWKNRYDMTINVALGTNDKEQELQHIMLIAQAQEKLMAAGMSNMVSPANIFNTVKKMVEASGLKHYELFFTDPATAPPPQPKPDPQAEFLKLQGQAEIMKAQVEQQKAKLEELKTQMDYMIAQEKLKLEAAKVQLQTEKAALDGLQKNNRLDLSEYQAELSARMTKYQTDLKAKSDIIKEKIKQETNEQRSREGS